MKAKCEATTEQRSEGETFPQCRRRAAVTIDGINLCIQHAGPIAVQKLVATGSAKQITEALCQLKADRRSMREFAML